jgi:site-specific DNA recombinase
MQVALYARVSTSPQEKTDPIESQLEALHVYVAAHHHIVLPEHLFLDNGVSGSRLDRPALDRLRDQARLGEFEAVIILSPDRLARSYPHQWLLLEEFKKSGCSVIFMENPFGDSPHGQSSAPPGATPQPRQSVSGGHLFAGLVPALSHWLCRMR